VTNPETRAVWHDRARSTNARSRPRVHEIEELDAGVRLSSVISPLRIGTYGKLAEDLGVTGDGPGASAPAHGQAVARQGGSRCDVGVAHACACRP
jgi:hypothetical protein